ncbi:MAG: DUF1735 and LamG domain-containing protein [Bacteroidales bacterium]|nr:DUF1735 and LamG domain-containing protein [Bacteroidales bacterium]
MIRKISGLLAMAAALFCGVSCENAKYNNIAPHAFINESVSSIGVSGVKSTFPTIDTDVELTVVLSDKVNSDASFVLAVDEAVLDRYNKEQGSSYELMDASMYEVGEPVVIPAGSYEATATVRVKAVPDGCKPGIYAIPVRLKKVSGDVDPTDVTSSYVAAFEVLKTSVDLPMFTGRSGLANSSFGYTLTTFTVETRFQVSNTANRNRDVFTNGKSVLLRFEDPQNDDDNYKAHSLVQFQGDGWYLNPDKSFDPNVWQHLALTYDGTKVTLYVNGQFAGSKEGSIEPNFNVVGWFGGDVDADGGHSVGDPQFWLNCKIIPHEARVWSTCRSEAQIKNNMTGVSAKSEGLVGYWSFEKDTYTAEGGFEDLTGNGHNLTTERSFVWVENILLAEQGVVWP